MWWLDGAVGDSRSGFGHHLDGCVGDLAPGRRVRGGAGGDAGIVDRFASGEVVNEAPLPVLVRARFGTFGFAVNSAGFRLLAFMGFASFRVAWLLV